MKSEDVKLRNSNENYNLYRDVFATDREIIKGKYPANVIATLWLFNKQWLNEENNSFDTVKQPQGGALVWFFPYNCKLFCEGFFQIID